MKAITLQQNGGIENLLLTEVAKPVIRAGEVLIKVKAIGINPVDAFVRQNKEALLKFLNGPDQHEPLILGWDVSGTVVEAGEEVTRFRVGDDVFGMVNFAGHGKAYAEYLAAPALHLAHKPASVSHEEAAAATLAALTAWQGLVTHGTIKRGDKVVIHAAAGGVGHYAVQMAKHFGAFVIGTASAANRDFVLGLGADVVVDYTRERFEEEVQDADLILDSVPGDHLLRSLKALKRGGRLISLMGFIEGAVGEEAAAKEVFATRMVVSSNGDDMQSIAGLLESGSLRSHVSHTFPFGELPKAHELIEKRKTRGKIVVQL